MTGPRTSTEETALAAAVDLIDEAGAVARLAKLLPFGDPFFGRDGRGPYILRDRAQAEKVLAATKAFVGSCDMMIDYDHQSELAATAGVGGTAKASGWVKMSALSIEDDGIWADIDWTGPAEAALAAREYRYLSPNFRVDRKTRLVTRLVNAGLTNSPNLELTALAHRQEPGASEGEDMTTIILAAAKLAAALALPADGLDETKVIAAIDKLKVDRDGSDAALASVRKELKLGDDAATDLVLAAVQSAQKAGEPDPTKYVPKAGYDELSGRLKKLEEDKVLAAVDDAVAAGKIAPAMKDWAINLGRKDPAELHSYIGQAVPFAGGAKVEGEPKAEKGKLSEEEKAICAMTGVSEADFLKTRDEEKVL